VIKEKSCIDPRCGYQSTFDTAWNFIIRNEGGHFPGWAEKLAIYDLTVHYEAFKKGDSKKAYPIGQDSGTDYVNFRFRIGSKSVSFNLADFNCSESTLCVHNLSS
jgi:hypothetical protein